MLSAAREFWPHIHVSDSLLMADLSVKMVEEGCKYIAVLGVDFMSENVQAILARAGHPDVQVCCHACYSSSILMCVCVTVLHIILLVNMLELPYGSSWEKLPFSGYANFNEPLTTLLWRR